MMTPISRLYGALVGLMTCLGILLLTGIASCSDTDGDGYPAPEDCDDSNAAVHPGAVETCDALDNDCDGLIDEACGSVCGNDEVIKKSFEQCGTDSGQIGQLTSAEGVTCEQVCCTFGFSRCLYRGAQTNYESCNPMPTTASGECQDVFAASWSSQCVCE